jgi:hypothetical protein
MPAFGWVGPANFAAHFRRAGGVLDRSYHATDFAVTSAFLHSRDLANLPIATIRH